MPIMLNSNGVAIDCPAKLNLTLAVAPPRADGLHPIASVMVALGLGDTLYLNPLNDGPSRFVRDWSDDRFDHTPDAEPGLPSPPIDWPIDKDLVYRAHALMQQAVGHTLAIECGLDKRIPAGAGLGGGSSDAAGMLFGLRELFDLGISDDRLVELGGQLGADVSFAVGVMLGRRAALVTGIGERIEPLAGLPGFDVALVLPGGVCPTGEVYAGFDRLLDERGAAGSVDEHAKAWRDLNSLPTPMNDLTPAAAEACPAVGQAIQTLAALGLSAHVTGSGSALFVLAKDSADARRIAAKAREAGLPALATAYDPYR